MKRFAIFLTLLSTFSVFLFITKPAAALFEGAKDQACQGIALTNTVGGNTCDATAGTGLSNILKIALNGFSLVVGVIAVIMIIIGGIKYITSSGDSNNVNSAKNTVLYAIIGLVLVLLAQVIVHFVVNRVSPTKTCPTGTSLLKDGSCG